ncbi:Proteinase inhibitor I1, Kazal [Metarhizium robertsii ARSEF 23]|uniref:Proteinase inhibitor I1, Kazal n=1 Tax=Metarhizium robertsii (strain ARSEF 23 / ATCC MYA-3075) TaxID=655844 RepID=E9ELW7_METRA|nr:Proteinase inhibitor I1, Kazal [Metarhizium robertsii ARSEF 23]EFZ03552.2 Proteinase inhibitor I1, Kazal [Metarhizium robertsii ARSEF 23]
MFHPLLVLLSTAALLQVGLATPLSVRDVAAEPGNVTSDSLEDAEAGRNCFCTMEYAPVCAGNKVYSNKCKAMCAGETEHSLGGCNQSS